METQPENLTFIVTNAINNAVIHISNNGEEANEFIEFGINLYPMILKVIEEEKVVFEQLLCFDKDLLN